jgi:CYTH domain-containing protein
LAEKSSKASAERFEPVETVCRHEYNGPMANDTGREIERKFLLRGLPAGVDQYPSVVIDQGYVPGTAVRERVRRTQDGATLRYYRTIKVGAGVERFEFEEETTDTFFVAVWPLTEGHRVRKRRYMVPSGNRVWEIDEFLDRDALILAEIELERADESVVPPPRIAAVIVREVTDEPGFSNYRLSR